MFRQADAADDGWCGNCPKCRFVGLMLAPFVEPADLTAIIGRDMFTDPDQVPGFAALISDDDKPFECVGERLESAAAISILSDLPQWKDKAVVTALAATGEEHGVGRRRQRPADRPARSSPSPTRIAAAVDRLLTGGRRDPRGAVRPRGWRCGESGTKDWPWSACSPDTGSFRP